MVDEIKSKIRTIPDFPKQGVLFRDITTLLKDPNGLRDVMKYFKIRYKGRKIDKVVGV
jgi:adenine phosphoribosyltransferase